MRLERMVERGEDLMTEPKQKTKSDQVGDENSGKLMHSLLCRRPSSVPLH